MFSRDSQQAPDLHACTRRSCCLQCRGEAECADPVVLPRGCVLPTVQGGQDTSLCAALDQAAHCGRAGETGAASGWQQAASRDAAAQTSTTMWQSPRLLPAGACRLLASHCCWRSLACGAGSARSATATTASSMMPSHRCRPAPCAPHDAAAAVTLARAGHGLGTNLAPPALH